MNWLLLLIKTSIQNYSLVRILVSLLFYSCFFRTVIGNIYKKRNNKVNKGPVSGFVGRIPLPTLENRINRNH